MATLTAEDRAVVRLANIDAEQAVLGILLDELGRNDFWRQCCAEIRRNVAPEDFAHDRHRQIAKAIWALADDGIDAEFAAVLPKIEPHHAAYLASLLGAYHGCALGGYYAAVVRDLAVKRRGLRAIGQSAKVFYDPQFSAQAALSESVRLLEEATAGVGEREGIFDLNDISERVYDLYEQGASNRGVSTGWPNMDTLYRVARGEWTLVTGMPSHGKSAWLDALVVQLAEKHGWRFAVCSPENQPLELHALKLARLLKGKPFSIGVHERLTMQDLTDALAWEFDHFTFVLPHEGRRSVAGVLALMETVIQRREVHGIVIDPWNELDHSRTDKLSETEYISQSLTAIRQFARRRNVHVWMVAHPTKLQKLPGKDTYPVPRPYDVSGSAHWWNKADNAICVYRDDEDRWVQVHVQKVRFDTNGQRGVAEFQYNPLTGRYAA